MDLAKTEKLQNLTDLGVDSDDTTDADNESNLGARLYVDVTSGLGFTAEVDLLLGGSSILLSVLFAVGKSSLLGGSNLSLEVLLGLGVSSLKLLDSLGLLGDRLGDATRRNSIKQC